MPLLVSSWLLVCLFFPPPPLSLYSCLFRPGNVGQYLSYDREDTHTYFSRDGGVTWEEVTKEAHVASFGDHGALMLALTQSRETNFIKFCSQRYSMFLTHKQL